MNFAHSLRSSLPSVIAAALLCLVLASPAVAKTEDEIKALRDEIKTLQQGQEKLQKDLAEIKDLLEKGARAAPGGQAFEPKDLVVGDSFVLGSEDAPVTLFSYSDYQCPYCSRHATTVLPDLVAKYVDAGKLRIVMREFPIERIHPRAFAAAQAAVCAGVQGQYQAMHDRIFTDQKALSDDDLRAHAGALGLNLGKFEACLGNKAVADGIRADIQEAQGMGISGTPSFVIGLTDPKDSDKVRVTRFIRGAQPYPTFEGAVENQLKQAAKGP